MSGSFEEHQSQTLEKDIMILDAISEHAMIGSLSSDISREEVDHELGLGIFHRVVFCMYFVAYGFICPLNNMSPTIIR